MLKVKNKVKIQQKYVDFEVWIQVICTSIIVITIGYYK